MNLCFAQLLFIGLSKIISKKMRKDAKFRRKKFREKKTAKTIDATIAQKFSALGAHHLEVLGVECRK